MPISPVATRELLVQARRRSTYAIRLIASLIAVFLVLWILLLAADSGGTPIFAASQGKALFSILSTMAFIYCLFVGPLLTADCLSAEKRDGTLGLVLLTDLKGYDIVLGKLASSSIHAVYGLIAILPMLSMALLFGGITAPQITQTILVLANTLFFSLAAGMFISTVSKHDRKAFFGAVLVILIVSAVPYELGYLMASRFGASGSSDFWEAGLLPSPVFAFTLTQSGVTGFALAPQLSASLAVTHSIAWILLLFSCLIVPRLGKERPKGKRREGWSEWWRSVTLGNRKQRALLRARLLDRNPCLWLSSRERYKPVTVWVLILPMALLGLWVYLKYPSVFVETALGLMVTVQILFKVWFTAETCGRWVEDRRNGALELLLCTPLATKTILRGQALALRRQFALPATAVVLLTILGCTTSIRLDGYEFLENWLFTIPLFLADLVTLRWVGAWCGLTARGLNRAMSATLYRVLLLRLVIFAGVIGVFAGLSWIGQGQIFSNWGALLPPLALVFDLYLVISAKKKFLRYLRAIASSPSDFKTSNPEPSTEVAKHEKPFVPIRVWRRPSRFAFSLAALILIISSVAFYYGYHYWLTRQIEARLDLVRDAGFPVSLEELDRARPPVSKETNAAVILEQASLIFVPLWRIPGQKSVRQNSKPLTGPFPYQGLNAKIQDRNSLTVMISTNQAGLDILHSAPSLRSGRYASDWRSPDYNTQVQALNTAAELLHGEVFLRIEENDSAGALLSLQCLLNLARSLDHETGYFWSHFRLACLKRVFTAAQALLSRHFLPLSSLEILDREFASLEADIDLRAILANERCLAIDIVKNPPNSFWGAGGGPPMIDQLRLKIKARFRHLTGADDRSLVAYLDMIREFVQVAQLPDPERVARGRIIETKYSRLNQWDGQDFRLTAQSVLDSLMACANLEARCRTSRIALAIERFRIQEGGKLPEKLTDLGPKFIISMRDPFNGEMHYRRLSEGYCVYSIGRNGRDDGGVETGRIPGQKGGEYADDISFFVK